MSTGKTTVLGNAHGAKLPIDRKLCFSTFDRSTYEHEKRKRSSRFLGAFFIRLRTISEQSSARVRAAKEFRRVTSPPKNNQVASDCAQVFRISHDSLSGSLLCVASANEQQRAMQNERGCKKLQGPQRT